MIHKILNNKTREHISSSVLRKRLPNGLYSFLKGCAQSGLLGLLLLAAWLLPNANIQAQTFPDTIYVTQDFNTDTTIVANFYIEATNKVQNPARVVYATRGDILLDVGFETDFDGDFLAESGIAFTAAKNISDAFIELSWFIDTFNLSLNDDNGTVYLQILNTDTQEEVYVEEIFVYDLLAKGSIDGTYRHYVGAERALSYAFNLYLEGAGEKLVTEMKTQGETDTFRRPNITISKEPEDEGYGPDKIQVKVKNFSDLIAEYKIYRENGEDDTVYVGSLYKFDSIFIDDYSSANENSIENGESYVYTIIPYSDKFTRNYTSATDTGATYAINLKASDKAYPNKVELTWKDVSSYTDIIRITRDGSLLVELPSTSVAYTDVMPVFGLNHTYELKLYKDEIAIVATSDTGSVDPVGSISGKVLTATNDIAVGNTNIQAFILVNGDTSVYTTTTNGLGEYELTGLYFGDEAEVTIIATNNDYTITNNTVDLSLSRKGFVFEDVNFEASRNFLAGTSNFTLSNLRVQIFGRRDLVRLNWNTTAPTGGNTVFSKVYRNVQGSSDSTLLTILQNGLTFTDSTGIPGQNYDYTVQAYVIEGDSLTQKSLSAQARYPVVSRIRRANIDIESDAVLGVIKLSFSHTSRTFTGYKIYRNNNLIDSVDASASTYIDYTGDPGSFPFYQITAYVIKDSMQYESGRRAFETGNIYPILPETSSLTALPDPTSDVVNLSWSYPVVDANYNYDGVAIYRNNVLLETIEKAFEPNYTDKTGIPEQTYIYSAKVYKENGNSLDVSDGLTDIAVYPPVNSPNNFTVVDASQANYHELSWDHTSTNHSGFILIADNDTIATLPLGSRTYKAMYSSSAPASINYDILSYVEKDSVTYYSMALSTSDATLSPGTAFPQKVSSFNASDNLSGHVLLTWKYPEYILADFQILRDGSAIETLATDNRVYYDYTATENTAHIYQIRAIYNTDTSYIVSDLGSLNSNNTLSGTITALNNGFGIPNATVNVTGTIGNNTYIASAKTDSSGFYLIKDIPNLDGTLLKVSADLQNHTFGPSIDTVVIQSSTSAYSVNFVDTVPNKMESVTAEVATPINVITTPDEIAQNVTIRWNIDSENYSGFKIYRGLVLLADISSQFARVVIDSTGFPGFDYAYSVQAYWQNGVEVVNSKIVSSQATYPQIAAPTNLHLVDLERSDQIQVSWSHPNNAHDYYLITRNEETIGQVPVSEKLLFNDTLGIPGQRYKYSVTAVKSTSQGLFNSLELTGEIGYPYVSPVTNLTSAVPENENYITLNWNHTSDNFTGYYIVRNDEIIDTVAAGVFNYTDREGIPGVTNNYEVITFVTKDNTTYTSVPVVEEVNYPAIQQPGGLFVVNRGEGDLDLIWSYDPADFTGFYVYRGGELLTTTTNIIFTDKTGIPTQTYNYSVIAFDIRKDGVFESAAETRQGTYPSVVAPFGTVASDTNLNYVTVTWSYNATNEDGFRVYKDGNLIATVPAGIKYYTEVTNTTINNSNYQVAAYKGVYESSKSFGDNGSTLSITHPPLDIANLTASDGEHSSKVAVTWTSSSGANVYIYRNNEHIASVTANEQVYNDFDAVPGKEYVYSIRASSSSGIADKGFRKTNGSLSGSVLTEQDGVGVSGISVVALTEVDGNRYTHSTVTDNSGGYTFENLYYGEDADFTVIASYPNHVFKEDSLFTSLDLSVSDGRLEPFIDKTAMLLAGNVYRDNVLCGLDSVKVTLYTTENGVETSTESFSDESGYYSFLINPTNNDITNYKVVVDTMKYYFEGSVQDSTFYNFSNREQSFDRAAIDNFPLVKEVNFADTTTYAVNIRIQTVCGPIEDQVFKYRVSSSNGCYSGLFQTSNNGRATLNLPPLDYELVITGANEANANTIAVVDYLRVRPVKLGLSDLHHAFESNLITQQQLSDTLIADFTYHTTPTVIVNNISSYLCEDPEQPAIFEQNKMYTLGFDVYEEHNNQECQVSEGYIIVRNDAATDSTAKDTLYFKNGSFEDYTFKGGDPITISPYLHSFVAEYHTESAGYVGQKTLAALVTGKSQIPGNDVIISLDESTIQIPLFILRDPPGDQSYSYIEEGITFEKELEVSDMNSGGLEFFRGDNFNFFGAGAYVNLSADAGGGEGESASFNVSVTTNQRIETANDAVLENNHIYGENGDVIVGVGVSTAYGIVETIQLINNCEIRKVTSREATLEGINTQWYYSVFQIEKLITEYQSQIKQVTDSILTLGKGSIQEDTTYLGTLINNWQSVLNYHRTTTVPMCEVCDLNNLPYVFKEALKDMQVYKDFCNVVKDDAGNCDFKNFVWTNDLMDKYNQLNTFKQELTDYIKYHLFDPRNEEYNDKLDAVSITNDILDNVQLTDEFYELFGPEVQNITFDGATGAIEKEIAVSRSRSRGYLQHTYLDGNLELGIKAQAQIKITKGIGIAVTTAPELDIENRTGVVASYNFEFEKTKVNSSDTSATVGYVLDDNDDGDQFSVTVVKGIDPTHTPYFSLLGGRSSCPMEEGTISRYDPKLFIQLPNGSFTKEHTLYNVDPEGPASFDVIMASNNQFEETLLYYLYAPTSLNPNRKDAEIFLQIGGENDGTGTRYIIPGDPQYTQVDIYKREGDVYDYENVMLSLAPKCEENYNTVSSQITFNVHFARPCSQVNLVNDGNATTSGDNWVINKAPLNEKEQLFIRMVDYDPESPILEDVTLSYRKHGENDWTDITSFTADSLLRYYVQFLTSFSNPTYPFVWDITDLNLSDGKYEIRAMTSCGANGENYSNVLTGTIDRTSLKVHGTPQPANGILSPGAEISVTFNESVDCSEFDASNLTLRHVEGDSLVDAIVSCFDNQLMVSVAPATLLALDGETLEATLSTANTQTTVKDVFGNVLQQDVQWSFTVHQTPVYWHPDSIEITMYRGESRTITGYLHNSGSITETYALDSIVANWLSASRRIGDVPTSGTTVDFVVDASELALGSHTQTVTADIYGYSTEKLTITVNVLDNKPDWDVNLTYYDGSMSTIVDFIINNGNASTDTMDIVSAWINNEVRAVANIKNVSGGIYAAYLSIAGDISELDEAIEFRVWDASEGIEYSAYPLNAITFNVNNRIGTTVNPERLFINPSTDIPGYTALHAGWNWFSINREQADMSIDNVLGSLSLTEGDQIKTQDQSSTFEDESWISLNDLDSLTVEDGYWLFLANADTLRITGAEATPENTVISRGWNLIGAPFKAPIDPDSALVFNRNLRNREILKSENAVADYQSTAGNWNGIDYLQPFSSYMLFASRAYLLTYNLSSSKSAINTSTHFKTAEATGWSVDPLQYEFNTTITGTIIIDEQTAQEGSYVAAFVGDECRGLGELKYNASIDKHAFTMFVYSNKPGEKVTFRILDAANNNIYATSNTMVNTINGRHGSIKNPVEFANSGSLKLNEPSVIAYPNPAYGNTQLRFTVPEDDTKVSVRIYNATGKLVEQLLHEAPYNSGIHEFSYDVSDLSAGSYLCKVQIGSHTVRANIIVVKQ